MDDIREFFDEEDTDMVLEIPEPRTGGDLRPNPTPFQTSNQEAVIPQETEVIESAIMEFSDKENIVIKTTNFHENAYQSKAYVSSEVKNAALKEGFSEPVQSHSNDARCYALMGASGGAGVTTLCIQLAHDIAKRTKKHMALSGHIDPTVCLIDLDFETGCCAAYLDVHPALSISDICGPADRIDASSLQALTSHHESGIIVLSTPNALGANSLANPETVLALLDAASQLYDHIIIDLPRIWQSWIGAAISGADHFAIVGELTIPSLHTARARIANIEKVLGEDQHCEVILNKVERRSFRNSVRLSDAEKALRRSVSASICIDLDTTREAINCGAAVATIRPEARYVKDVSELSLKWLPQQDKKGGLFKDRRKKRAAA